MVRAFGDERGWIWEGASGVSQVKIGFVRASYAVRDLRVSSDEFVVWFVGKILCIRNLPRRPALI